MTPWLCRALLRRGKGGAALGRLADDVLLLGLRRTYARSRTEGWGGRDSPTRRRIYRELWTSAAEAVGAAVEEGPGGLLDLRRGTGHVRVLGHLVDVGGPVSLAIAGDKPLVHEQLRDAGVPIPESRTVAVADPRVAADLLDGGRVVVKPAAGTGAGRGVTGGVGTTHDLHRAALRAGRYDAERLLVERQLDGREFRVLVLHGEPLGCVERRPPSVRGDGERTVAQLITAENRRRRAAAGRAGLVALTPDLDTVLALRAQDSHLDDVLDLDRAVRVKTGTSQGSERDATVRPLTTPELTPVVDRARAAAATLAIPLLSVELIVPDVAGDPCGAAVIEVNTTPGIAQHYLVDDPATVEPVAERLLEALLA